MFFDRIYIQHIVIWSAIVLIIMFSVYKGDHYSSISLVKAIYKQNTKQVRGNNPLLFFRPVDINHTTFNQLRIIPGVGYKEALKILSFVQEQGFLFDVSELEFPEGPLGAKEFQRIRVYICVR